MVAEQAHSKLVGEIARQQLDLFDAVTEDSENVVTLDTVETQHYCEQKALFEHTEAPDEENRPERLIRSQEQHSQLVAATANTDEEYAITDSA